MRNINLDFKIARNHNFSAGPSKLPDPVIEKMASEMLDYNSRGVAIFEISHRDPLFDDLLHQTLTLFRELFLIPKNFKVAFIHGGASLQFAMIPLNFKAVNKKAAYVDSGFWSQKAIKEAQTLGGEFILASGKNSDYKKIPDFDLQELPPTDFSYLHITSNNSIFGTQYQELPNIKNIPLIVDATSEIGSKFIDFNKVAMVYGSNQKNLGVSGIGFAIIREDLLDYPSNTHHPMINYKAYIKNNSMYNTPNTLGIYVTKLILEWIKSKGGISVILKETKSKANLLYKTLDEFEGFYFGHADVKFRSQANISFKLKNADLEKQFLIESKNNNLLFLKGHRLLGGVRASLYNATEIESVQTLTEFMRHFAKKHS